MTAANPTIWLAFIAGVLSFASPCVFPLIPAYVSYLSGRAGQQLRTETIPAANGQLVKTAGQSTGHRFVLFAHGLSFVGGLTFFFVAFGLLTNASLHLVQQFIDVRQFLQVAGGFLVIIFGLHVLGVFGWLLTRLINNIRWPSENNLIRQTLIKIQVLLYSDTRRQMNPRARYGYLGSALMGLVFAAGWSPCIGPIYGSILDLSYNATSGSSFLTAGVLLLAYSLGLGIPFLLAAIGLDQLRGLLKRIQRQMHTLELISGVFLIGMGVLLMTGQLAVLAQASSGSSTLTNLEGCVTGVLTGQVPSGDFGTCMDLGVDYKSQQALAANGLADAQSAVLPTPTAIPAELAGTVGVGVGQTAPDFTVQTLDGKSVSLNSLRGRVVLLNFWATWCLPCRSEMPAFQKIAASYKSTDFTILAVNFRETQDQVQQYAHDLALTLPLGIDPQGTIGTMYHAVNFPVSYIIGRDGVILRRQLGPFTLSTLAAEIDHIVTPGG